MLPKKNRLSKNNEFRNLFKKGKSFKNDCLLIRLLPNKKDFNRFGFIVSLKISKKAVVRNKIKRALRQIIREDFSKIRKGFDLAIITFPGIEKKSYRQIKEIIGGLFEKAKLINNDQNG